MVYYEKIKVSEYESVVWIWRDPLSGRSNCVIINSLRVILN
jgi:hypothetical protein